ncbi:hypothetical protein LP419_18785 [Massilia sp. H-1]|nr:hypothetical protein LP419_18785 [Massilia sp. H-1]
MGGLNAMPAKGGNPDLDDVEIKRAVVYMANKGGAKFDEPKAPEAAAPAAAPAAEAAPAAAAAAKQRRPQQHQPPSQPKSPSMARKYSTQAAQLATVLKHRRCAKAGRQGSLGTTRQARRHGPVRSRDQGLPGQGLGMMPPKGGSTASDDEIKAAVDYMVGAAK